MAFVNKWFKVIQNDKLIGTVTDQSFARYSEKSGRLHICRAIEGQYLLLNDKYYRDDWMLGENPNANVKYDKARIIAIRESEYDILQNPSHEPVKHEIVKIPAEKISKKVSKTAEVTIDFVRARKLNELGISCTKSIEQGFSLVLSDGASHHFSMTAYDQLNLLQMEIAFNNGSTDILYHADNELMQYYGEDDVRYILSAAKRWKEYNLALFNSFKNWINNLNDLAEIDRITYESEIPEKYCTDVLTTLTNNL